MLFSETSNLLQPKSQLVETISARALKDMLREDASFEAPKRERAAIDRPLRAYALADAAAFVVGFFAAWALASLMNSLFLDRAVANPFAGAELMRLVQFGVIGAGAMVWFAHSHHYNLRMPFWQEAKKIVAAMALAMLVDGFLQFASKADASRLWLVAAWAVAAFAIIGLRAVTRALMQRRGEYQVATLLVGNGATAQMARKALETDTTLGYRIVAQIKDLPTAYLQSGRSWEQLAAAHGADYVLLALDGEQLPAAEKPIAQLMREDMPFSVVPPMKHVPVQGMVPQYTFNHDMLMLTRASGLEQRIPQFAKRALDVLICGSAVLALSPVFLIVGALVKMDGGPAFFGSRRVGKDGKMFSCLKFRSMAMNNEAMLEAHLAANPEAREEWETFRKLKNDPRVTKLGDFLRKSSLDELPQLLNVIRGEMSLVGPRPISQAEVANYEQDIAHYYRVRPGITGLWQVSGRSDVSYAERVQMDSWYVRNWSLWHDIAIFCKTFPAILNRTGVY